MRAWCISASYSRTSGTCDEQVPRSVATELAAAKATASISSWYSSSASIWNSLAQSSSIRSTEPEDAGTCTVSTHSISTTRLATSRSHEIATWSSRSRS